jgi:hypothetical protein
MPMPSHVGLFHKLKKRKKKIDTAIKATRKKATPKKKKK